MLLLVGQVPRAFRGREAWQEIDYAHTFDGSRRRRGRSTAPSGFRSTWHAPLRCALRAPGAVVLALPEDVLAETADVADGAPVVIEHAPLRADDLGLVGESSLPPSVRCSRRRGG